MESFNLCSDTPTRPSHTTQQPLPSPRSRLQRFQSFSLPLRMLQFVVALSIFCYAALSPAPQFAGQHADTSLHFVGNILLFVSAWVALWGRLSVRVLVMLLLPFSCAIELAQYLSPGRMVDIKDMAVNVAGLSVGAVIALVLQRVLGHLLR